MSHIERQRRANQALAARVEAHATGALSAQKVKQSIREGADCSLAFDALLDLVDRYGGTANTPAIAAFTIELAKAART